MGIPAGNVGGLKAGHILVADDHILQDLIERRTDMDIAIGVGRAIVKDKAGLLRIVLHELVISAYLILPVEQLRLPLGKAGPHGEIRLRQMDCLVIIFCH